MGEKTVLDNMAFFASEKLDVICSKIRFDFIVDRVFSLCSYRRVRKGDDPQVRCQGVRPSRLVLHVIHGGSD